MGDQVPLLRLAAESPEPTDIGDPAGFQSLGANVAVYCSDSRFVWDKNAPEAMRRAQYNAALAAIPPSMTAPFSPAAWVALVKQPVAFGPIADTCLPWPAPTRPNPPFAPNTVFSHTPALVMGGDYDLVPLGDMKAFLKHFPQGHFVEVANAGHFTGVWSPCAQAIDLHFIATLLPLLVVLGSDRIHQHHLCRQATPFTPGCAHITYLVILHHVSNASRAGAAPADVLLGQHSTPAWGCRDQRSAGIGTIGTE